MSNKFTVSSICPEDIEILIIAADNSSDGICILEAIKNESGMITDFRHSYINKAGAYYYDLPQDEIIGKSISQIFPDYLKSNVFKAFNDAIIKKEAVVLNDAFLEANLTNATSGCYYEIEAKPIGEKLFVSWKDISELKKINKNLNKVNEELKYQAVLTNTVNNPIVGIDKEFNINFWNKAAEKVYGYTKEEALGKSYREITRTESSIDQGIRAGEKLRRDGFIELEAIHYSKTGEKIFFDLTAIMLKDDNGGENGLVVVSRDMTSRRKDSEKILLQKQRSEQLAELSKELSKVEYDYNAVLDTTVKRICEIIGDTCVIRLLSKDGKYINPVAYYHPDNEAMVLLKHMYETSPQKISEGLPKDVVLTGEPLLIPDADKEMIRNSVKREHRIYLDKYPVYSFLSVALIVQDKIIGTLSLSKFTENNPYTIEDQHFVQTLADHVALTITNAKLYKEINAERELLQSIIDTVPVMITIYDADVEHLQLNKAFETITGYNQEDHLKYGVVELAYPDPEYRKTVYEFVNSLQPGFKDFQMVTKNGETVETSWANVQIKDGRKVGIGIDITDRKKAEEALAKSQKRLLEAQRLAHIGSYHTDYRTSPAKVEFSEELYNIYGIDPEKEVLTEQLVLSRIHPEDLPFVSSRNKPTAKGNYSEELEFRIVLPDGSIKHLYTRRVVVFDNNGKLLEAFGTTMDITERKTYQLKLEKSQNELKEAQRLAHLGNITFDADTGKINWSEETYRIFERHFEKGAPSSSNEAMSYVHPDDRDYVLNCLKKSQIDKSTLKMEYRIITDKGNLKYIRHIGTPIFDKEEKFTKRFGTVLDITEQRMIDE